jgi:O-antigen/teichoic acid export membrane protein
MSTIRRQSIISSFVIYIGFAVGLFNVYFFTTRFDEHQYGLTSIFINIATLMSVISMVAMPSFIFKFYHYYNDNLPPKKNDMLTWALVVSLVGFLLVLLAGWFFKDLVFRKFGENAPLLLTYYNWIFPMGLGLSIYLVLEAYAWNVGKPILTSFLREVQWRLLTTVLILLFITGVIKDFGLFIKLYAFTYPGIAITLLLYLIWTKKISFTFRFSKVSRRFLGSITRFIMFFYSGAIIFIIPQVFDTLVIASLLKDGAAMAGIFSLAQIMASVIQAPQRGIIAASISHLSRAWKDKNMATLQRIYQRSSINQLVFALGLFMLIALNYTEAVKTIPLRESYLLGFNAFLLLGLMRIIDMGTGVNSQIIGTSNYWKFELISGVILILVMLPLTYIFTKNYGLIGPAIANLISMAVYNFVRIYFLWKKFRLFPFTIETIYTLLLALTCSAVCYFLFLNLHGFAGLIFRSLTFIILYASGAIMLRLSPDIQPVLQTIRKKLGIRSSR